MASAKPSHFLLVVVFSISLLSHHQVHCDDDVDQLIQGLNDFRSRANLPSLRKSKNARCAAKKIANDLEDKPCSSSSSNSTVKTLSDYPNAISKCNIDPNTTSDAIVLPVCVPGLVPDLVLANFTDTHFSKYIKDGSVTGIGTSTEDDWMVTVLAKNTPSGSLANGAFSLVNAKVGLGNIMALLLLGLVLCLVQ